VKTGTGSHGRGGSHNLNLTGTQKIVGGGKQGGEVEKQIYLLEKKKKFRLRRRVVKDLRFILTRVGGGTQKNRVIRALLVFCEEGDVGSKRASGQ